MTAPVFKTIDATWPPAALHRAGPWCVREGRGGGKRVSAATAEAEVRDADIPLAEREQARLGQPPLFMIRSSEIALDALLADRGYAVVDPVVVFSCPPDRLTDRPLPRVTAFAVWEPLAVMREIWETGGIGPARQAIMDRAAMPKTALFGRHADRPAGAGFVAIHEGIAMVHALEILPAARRQGLGGWMMRLAAFWAASQGAGLLTVMCTRANAAACGLYASLGMTAVEGYHYRQLPEGTPVNGD